MKTIPLKKPVKIGDKTVSEVNLDFDSLTGADIMFCVSEAAAQKGVVVSYVLDTEVHLQLVMKLSGLSRNALLEGPAADLNKMLAAASAFFLDTD